MSKVRPFLTSRGPHGSVLIGAPDEFDFIQALRQASSIRAAIAFGHMTGWRKVENALRASSAKSIRILLGQAFLQTEPDVLDELYTLKSGSFQGRLAPSRPTFHPKVWMIETPSATHLIIGSANLSYGGFVGNTECSAYLKGPQSSEAISSWFDGLWKRSSPLTDELCRKYREQYNKAAAPRAKARTAIEAAGNELANAQMEWRRNDATREARRYFATTAGKEAAQHWREAMDRIRKCLNPPTFQFSKEDWLQFLSIPEFGSMGRIRRDTAQLLPDIRRAFLHLADERIELAQRVNDVVPHTGRFHVPGIGRNIATKILAMLHPKDMPVYNGRVEKALIAFGYRLGGEKSEGDRYRDFCREIRLFAQECELPDVLSVDPFFEHYSRVNDNA